ncbi:hypothetical protein Naga_101419g1 [Nannochloropsis gaditana]|uniref:Uncharacterized protein n=1 Tax=Nannochloropsis gaditana TaxID=72520 RepID=W7TB14_9STRA|nr:hypothetical protein Naga_101419g1 [Nannochloropsis gaditana]
MSETRHPVRRREGGSFLLHSLDVPRELASIGGIPTSPSASSSLSFFPSKSITHVSSTASHAKKSSESLGESRQGGRRKGGREGRGDLVRMDKSLSLSFSGVKEEDWESLDDSVRESKWENRTGEMLQLKRRRGYHRRSFLITASLVTPQNLGNHNLKKHRSHHLKQINEMRRA